MLSPLEQPEIALSYLKPLVHLTWKPFGRQEIPSGHNYNRVHHFCLSGGFGLRGRVPAAGTRQV